MKSSDKFDYIVSMVIGCGTKRSRRFEDWYKLHIKKFVFFEYRSGFQSLLLCRGSGEYTHEGGYEGDTVDYLGDRVLFHNITTPHIDIHYQKIVEKYDTGTGEEPPNNGK